MAFPDHIPSAAAGLAVIAIGLIAFVALVRRRPDMQSLGFAACEDEQPAANALAERLFGQSPHSVYRKNMAGRDSCMMFVSAGSSDTPDCVAGFADIAPVNGASDLILLHSQRRIPKILRQLHGGVLASVQPVDPPSDATRPAKGWFWYAPGDGALEDTPVARALARATRDREAKGLLGIAHFGTQVVVWASHSNTESVISRLEHLLGGPLDAR